MSSSLFPLFSRLSLLSLHSRRAMRGAASWRGDGGRDSGGEGRWPARSSVGRGRRGGVSSGRGSPDQSTRSRRRAAGGARRARAAMGGRRASSRSLRACRITRGAATGGCGRPPSSDLAPYSPDISTSCRRQAGAD
uniref:Uncharacterized protein n=1 Tax=Oryza sativa subsp. japonica TaxID=39947 RepID=Q653P4_ORYSJ|nr:hypothetical protein [Oryza sativa Japonica Group]BAD45973.1 hypothetical protein [Oryza sativa Japonica Group]